MESVVRADFLVVNFMRERFDECAAYSAPSVMKGKDELALWALPAQISSRRGPLLTLFWPSVGCFFLEVP
jgi:hypothetical protein